MSVYLLEAFMRMFSIPRALGLAIAAGLIAVGAAAAGERLKSGPQAGERTTAFDVQDVTGPNKGKTLCYV
jgi:hypothetical protein